MRPLLACALAVLLSVASGGQSADAKTPGSTYCFNGVCHRVKTLAETVASVGKEEEVLSSYYWCCSATSSGERFRADRADNAASPIYPNGTVMLVWSSETGASVIVRINNAGPYWGRRTLDVSRAAAKVLGFTEKGVTKLKVRVLSAPTLAEATYKRNRTYDPVPGYIGRYASLDAAHAGAASAYAVAALASALPGQATPPAVALAQAGVRAGSPPAADGSIQLAAVEAAPPPEIKPVGMEGLVAMREVPQVASAGSLVEEKVRVRSRAERAAPRNSRAYRVAARKQRKAEQPKVAAAAPPRRPPQGWRSITEDGTNDMSVFSRHIIQAGMERFADSRRRTGSRLARQSARDRDDG